MSKTEMTAKQKKLYKQALKEMDGFFDDKMIEHLTQKIFDFKGNFDVLESAVGALVIGRVVGWRVLQLVHSSRTYNKYQKVLGLEFKGTLPWDDSQPVMPERGSLASKSIALKVADKVGDFWGVVAGHEKVDKKEADAVV